METSRYDAALSWRRLEATIASGDGLDIRHFEVKERMSALFEVALTAVSPNPDIDFEAVIGRPMRFVARAGGEPSHERVFTGVCRDIRQVAVEERGLSTYELTLVPTLWLATQRRNHRIFQLMSEIDIARQVLTEWEVAPQISVTGAYKKRKYRVQYGESDFTFLCRMLEDAGVSFHFETQDEESRLVLCDSPQAGEARAPIVFRDAPGAGGAPYVTGVRVGRRVRPGAYTVRDHDPRRAATFPLLATAKSASPVEERLERFHYVPGAFLYESAKGESTPGADDRGKYRTDEGEATHLAARRLEAKRATARLVTFATNLVDPRPGTVLSFVDHPRRDLAAGRRLLVLASDLSGTHDGEWRHVCEAVSAEQAYRPELSTPRPRVSGVESATVVGPPGEEIHTDEFGRVRVHFHWDREGAMDETASCWIHVSQPWGGAGFGGSNLPRVGQEVIVDFLGGDPDRPVVVGRVYTNLQKTPYKLPENKTQSGWKSNSTGGSGGYNELMFEDAAGQELLRMQAEKDLHKLVKNDEATRIGHDQTHAIGHDETRKVGNDRRREVGHDEALEVKNDRKRKVGNDESVEVARDETREVKRDRARNVGRDEDVSVGRDRSKTVGRNETIFISNSQSDTIGQDRTIQVGGNHAEAIDGDKAQKIGGSALLAIEGSKGEQVKGDSALQVGGSYAVSVDGGMSTVVKQDQVEVVSGAKLVQVGKQFELVCGPSRIHVDAAGTVIIEASSISLKASAAIEIDAGSSVKIEAGGPIRVAGSTVSVN